VLAEILLTAALLAGAPDTGIPEAPKPVDKRADQEAPVITRHSAVVGDKQLSYLATAGFLPVMNDAGEAEAQIFYVSYTSGTPNPDKSRPIFFFLNGGPGAA
jgi:carboxypeptidase C (cathepsin A)